MLAMELPAELLDWYRDSLEERQVALRVAVDGGDRATVRELAHKVRGSAGAYGFDALSALAGQVEDADDADLIPLAGELLDAIAEVRG